MAVLIKEGNNLIPVNTLMFSEGGSITDEPITITQNGVTNTPDGVRYNPITVNVELGLQEKNVDITSNGTSEVLPDDGYTGLSKVNINANVPDSIPYTQAMIDGSEYIGDIVIPNNVTEIAQYAFYNKSNLKGNLILSNNVTIIKDYAFWHCSGLTNLALGNNLTDIKISAFNSCSGLNNVLNIPSNVKIIENQVFQNCSNLTGLILNEGLEKIGSTPYFGYTFEKCYNISGEVTIPSTVTYLSGNTFDGCRKVEKFIYKAQVFSIPRGFLYGCSGCKTFKCETAITSIGQQTFESCSAMELYDFRNCTVVPTLADTTLRHKDGCQIVVPDALYDEWIAATNWSSLTNVTFVKASEYVEV